MVPRTMARERLFALREQIARLEGRPAPALAAQARQDALAAQLDADTSARQDFTPVDARLPLGIEELDRALEGGFPLRALCEIRAGSHRDAGAASGFTLALSACLLAGFRARAAVGASGGAMMPGAIRRSTSPSFSSRPLVFWISDRFCAREDGRPYPVGLEGFGLSGSTLIEARPRRLDEALFAAEAALRSGLFCATILEIAGNPKGFGLTESRRLSLRAKAAGRPLILLRMDGAEEAGSTALRLKVETAPARARRLPDGAPLSGSLGNPVFRLTLEKSRLPAPLSFFLEWNPDDCQFLPAAADGSAQRPAHSRTVPAISGDRAAAPGAASWRRFGQG
ncbi:hypothetical protein BJF93_15625 [Xaviernesmea oryzae]|uniref:Protein ImuA n=1 Tax=Xaviernesmea oryzae TaxID=464029 RepID=A0A1Q9AY85_9HYPH|nr:hypothetical protein [Xaviernesmea oryzae]OLP60375.1 hypothetical protein BJF93_15625 [Xaviernesmea oryzae]SEK20944.1 protein ImuA [Xaviernesmea oryzae]